MPWRPSVICGWVVAIGVAGSVAPACFTFVGVAGIVSTVAGAAIVVR
jgi:hypothetical protein